MTGSDGRHVSRDAASQLASELHDLMQGLPVGAQFTVPPSADICCSLELFIPGVLRLQYPEWEKESLDGIFVARATKTGSAAAELIGTCILISDQTVTPFLLDLNVSRKDDFHAVTAFQIMIGEPGSGPLGISGPPCNSREAQRLLMSLIDRIDEVAWSYTLTSDKLG
ncbi:hypothetical protein [Sorangium sp. So ce513]|uniref:hypothetical protein n=1 Tax=Sorangium sp. So ce513 TaxID=3133315 RepID=UPI003F62A29B